MLYNLSKEDVNKILKSPFMPEFRHARKLYACFRTDADVVRQVLPKPLKPPADPLALVYVAHFPHTNFGSVYNEGALFVRCEYHGEVGAYCLSLPVDDDMALIGGRELYGYPKKIAERITLEQHGSQVVGSVVRKGTEILRVECELEGEEPAEEVCFGGQPTTDWDGIPAHKLVVFLFKYFTSPCVVSLDYLPRMIRQPLLFRKEGLTSRGTGRVVLRSTPADPLADIPVGEILGMSYGTWHDTMLPGKVVARRWNPWGFLRHAFFKSDFTVAQLADYDLESAERARRAYKAARKY